MPRGGDAVTATGPLTGNAEQTSTQLASGRQLAERIRRWSGNPASIIQASPAQATAMTRRRAPTVRQLRRDPIAPTEADLLKARPAGRTAACGRAEARTGWPRRRSPTRSLS